jgi:hypothetical protein
MSSASRLRSATSVDGLGTCTLDGRAILLTRPLPCPDAAYLLTWTDRSVQLIA